MHKMTANICMSNKNDKHNVKQRTEHVFIHSLEAGAKMISYSVSSCNDSKLIKSTFQNRATLQIYNLWL